MASRTAVGGCEALGTAHVVPGEGSEQTAIFDYGQHVFVFGHQALHGFVKAEVGTNVGDSAFEDVVPLNQIQHGLVAVRGPKSACGRKRCRVN